MRMSDKECVCNEMITKLNHEDASEFTDRYYHSCVSWDCEKHGKVSVDNRSVQHTHPPAYTSSRLFDPPKAKFPDRRVRG
jgi:hypothetical protein